MIEHAPTAERIHEPVQNLLDFLLWLEYARSGLVPGLAPWKSLDKRELVKMLLLRVRASVAYLEEQDDLGSDFVRDMAGLNRQCMERAREILEESR